MSGKHREDTSRRTVKTTSDSLRIPGERRRALDEERGSRKSQPEPERNREARLLRRKRKNANRRLIDWVIIIAAEILITLGLVAGLFLLWKFVLSDAFAEHQQTSIANSYIKSVSVPVTHPKYNSQEPPELDSSSIKNGTEYGVIYIPRLDPNYKRALIQGTDAHSLSQGVGHYSTTQMPGDYGNFALAGHRNTVFKNLKSVVPGDNIYIQTKDGYYTYKVEEPHFIVLPTAVKVIAPIPNQSDSTVLEAKASQLRVLTLTTCWPEWSNTQRLVVYAKFVEWRPLDAGAPQEILQAAK